MSAERAHRMEQEKHTVGAWLAAVDLTLGWQNCWPAWQGERQRGPLVLQVLGGAGGAASVEQREAERRKGHRVPEDSRVLWLVD